ncbi:MAG: hypothetical protein ACLPID_02515 [Beijerinckiaceae bacterium]
MPTTISAFPAAPRTNFRIKLASHSRLMFIALGGWALAMLVLGFLTSNPSTWPVM